MELTPIAAKSKNAHLPVVMSVKRKLITDEEEVIQDSEPEREDARKRLKEERRRHRRPNKSDNNMSITTDYTSDSDTETSYAIAGTRTTGSLILPPK